MLLGLKTRLRQEMLLSKNNRFPAESASGIPGISATLC